MIRRDPPRLWIVSKAELSQLVHYHDVVRRGLRRDFIAKADAVIERSDNEIELSSWRGGFLDRNSKFIVVIPHFCHFAPGLLPHLVMCALRRAHDAEAVAKGRAILQHKAKSRREKQVTPVPLERVVKSAIAGHDRDDVASVG